MPITNEQDIPTKPKPSEPWTINRLFPFAGATVNIAKTFSNPLEVLLGFNFFVVGAAVLFGREVPGLFYGLCTLLLVAVVYERLREPKQLEFFEKEKKTKKK